MSSSGRRTLTIRESSCILLGMRPSLLSQTLQDVIHRSILSGREPVKGEGLTRENPVSLSPSWWKGCCGGVWSVVSFHARFRNYFADRLLVDLLHPLIRE